MTKNTYFKARNEMIANFQKEAYIIMSDAIGLRRRNIENHLARLASNDNEYGKDIAKAIREKCVFNLANFLLQYVTTNLTQQAMAEMLLQTHTFLSNCQMIRLKYRSKNRYSSDVLNHSIRTSVKQFNLICRIEGTSWVLVWWRGRWFIL